MPKDMRIYEVFISSPSDVNLERDVVQEAIEQINRYNGSKEGYRLNPLRWESDVSSQFGSHPQKIINEQIGDDYDIFVGILCNRFGQKTELYESGTEEEFYRAYERFDSLRRTPEILFFFKDARKSNSPIDADQYIKVSEFKKCIGKFGIYEDFDSSESLRAKVTTALLKAIDRMKKDSPDVSDRSEAQAVPLLASSEYALVNVDDFDEDIGIIDLTEMVYVSFEVVTDNLETMGAATGKLGERLQFGTDEITNMQRTGDVRKDQGKAKVIIEKIAAEMQRYCHKLDQCIPSAQKEFSTALRCMQHAVIISHQDGVSDQEDMATLVKELVDLNSIVKIAYEQIGELLEAVSKTPRMTSKLNQAKRRTIKSINDLLEFLKEASESIEVTLGAIVR